MAFRVALTVLGLAPVLACRAADPPGEVRRLDSYAEVRLADRVEAVGVAPDGKTLAVCSRKRVQLWQVDPPKSLGGWDVPASTHFGVRLRADRLVLVRNDIDAVWRLDLVDVRDPAKPKPVASVRLKDGLCFVDGVGLAKDVVVALVSAIEERDTQVVRTWALADGAEVGAARKVPGATSLAVSRSGTRVAVSDLLGDITVRDLASFEEVATVSAGGGDTVAAFGPDDKSLLIRSGAGGYSVMGPGDPAATVRIPGEAFSPECPVGGYEGLWIGGGADGRVVVYDPAGQKVAGGAKGDGRPIRHLAVSTAGPVLVSAAADSKAVLIWRAEKLGLGGVKK
jgi:WD40 repeat protein